MAAPAPSTVTAEISGFSFRLPHWSRFLLSMILLIVVGTVLRGGFGLYQERLAIREIERVGGMIVGVHPRRPEWLWSSLASDIQNDVYFVAFERAPVTDATLYHVGCLTHMTFLLIHDAPITDAGLANLRFLTRLEELSLRRTNVSDAGLIHLKEFQSLRVLWLDDTLITDAGLSHLKRMVSLKEVSIRNTSVTAAGVAELKRALPGITIVQ